MKLIEAMRIVGAPTSDSASPFRVLLATGFNSLHLHTFLAARLRVALPNHHVDVQTGLYGDLLGTLENSRKEPLDAASVVIEWPDLDPRLGLRQLGGWDPRDLADIVDSVRAKMHRIENAIRRLSDHVPLAVCFPTLPLPPASFEPGWQASGFALQIRECIAAVAARLCMGCGIRMVSAQRLDRVSPPGDRLNVKSELLYGFPYQVRHSAALSQQLTLLIQSRPPKKGLITDLDDTLWNGMVGEVGPQ